MPGSNLLVIEDDAELLQVMSHALHGAGHNVLSAATGESGLRLFRAEPPDLVVCDIVMPDRDGIELIPEMKAAHPLAKVLAISGRQMIGSLDVLHLAKQLGADATLGKPFSIEALIAIVEALLMAE